MATSSVCHFERTQRVCSDASIRRRFRHLPALKMTHFFFCASKIANYERRINRSDTRRRRKLVAIELINSAAGGGKATCAPHPPPDQLINNSRTKGTTFTWTNRYARHCLPQVQSDQLSLAGYCSHQVTRSPAPVPPNGQLNRQVAES